MVDKRTIAHKILKEIGVLKGPDIEALLSYPSDDTLKAIEDGHYAFSKEFLEDYKDIWFGIDNGLLIKDDKKLRDFWKYYGQHFSFKEHGEPYNLVLEADSHVNAKKYEAFARLAKQRLDAA